MSRLYLSSSWDRKYFVDHDEFPNYRINPLTYHIVCSDCQSTEGFPADKHNTSWSRTHTTTEIVVPAVRKVRVVMPLAALRFTDSNGEACSSRHERQQTSPLKDLRPAPTRREFARCACPDCFWMFAQSCYGVHSTQTPATPAIKRGGGEHGLLM